MSGKVHFLQNCFYKASTFTENPNYLPKIFKNYLIKAKTLTSDNIIYGK